MYPEFDERDEEIRQECLAAIDEKDGPRVGDFVRYANGDIERIAYIWDAGDGKPHTVQTSKGGSFHLGKYGVSMSGSLNHGCMSDTLTLTEEKRDGAVWFFHHGWAQAHNGVSTTIPFRVYATTAEHSEIRPKREMI